MSISSCGDVKIWSHLVASYERINPIIRITKLNIIGISVAEFGLGPGTEKRGNGDLWIQAQPDREFHKLTVT